MDQEVDCFCDFAVMIDYSTTMTHLVAKLSVGIFYLRNFRDNIGIIL